MYEGCLDNPGAKSAGTTKVSNGLVRIATSTNPDPQSAAEALLGAMNAADLAGIIVFATQREALQAVASIGKVEFGPDLTIIGCTTAGEITPWGPQTGGISAVGFPACDFSLQARCFDGLLDFNPFAAHRTVAEAIAEGNLASATMGAGIERAAILLIDGLSCREELITHTMRHILEDIPIVGGSAGDDMQFRATHVLHDGKVREDCAVMMVLWSRHPLRVFRSHHHEASNRLAVVTRADPATRTVYELNGQAAIEEYASLADVAPEDLDDRIFASNPLMVRVGGSYYARAPMRVTSDGALIFHSAIERGLVFRLGVSTGMVDSLHQAMSQTHDTAIDSVIAFENIHDRIESQLCGYAPDIADLYANHRFIGFHTYGELYRDLHLNRNLVGLIIGSRMT